jgi:hypothetical protein
MNAPGFPQALPLCDRTRFDADDDADRGNLLLLAYRMSGSVISPGCKLLTLMWLEIIPVPFGGSLTD